MPQYYVDLTKLELNYQQLDIFSVRNKQGVEIPPFIISSLYMSVIDFDVQSAL
jgi:hypothetical protein